MVVPSMSVKTGLGGRRTQQVGSAEYRTRFGLSPAAVLPLFAPRVAGGPVPAGPYGPGHAVPQALVVYDPALSRRRRLLARLGASRTVAFGVRARPVHVKALAFVGLGGVAGMMLAQPFDVVTFAAPLYGLVVGATAGGAGWVAVRSRGSTTIWVEQWRNQLETVARILHNADRMGQPFVSPPALRSALHVALWHAANAVGEPGDVDVLHALDEQLLSLRVATDSAVAELESPSIAARKAAVSEQLAAAVEEMTLSLPTADGARSGDDSS